jgi:uncharacterized DUF497 family protein
MPEHCGCAQKNSVEGMLSTRLNFPDFCVELKTLQPIFLYVFFYCIVMATRFEWDQTKNRQNQSKHGVAFELAQLAFADPRRVIAEDLQHSESESRYYCFGKAGGGVMTVRFTYRENVIRILGAGYWRRGKAIYERENKIHK